MLGGHIVLVGQKTLVVYKALVGHIALLGITVCWALGLVGLLGTWPY